MTRDPKRPGETFAEFIARLRSEQAARGVPLPKPTTDAIPPAPFQDTDTQQDEEGM